MGYCSLSFSCHWKKWLESCGHTAGADQPPGLDGVLPAALGAGLRQDHSRLPFAPLTMRLLGGVSF